MSLGIETWPDDALSISVVCVAGGLFAIPTLALLGYGVLAVIC